jgi:hypothetical protein
LWDDIRKEKRKEKEKREKGNIQLLTTSRPSQGLPTAYMP